MSNQIKVVVLLATFNGEKFLRDQLTSIASQKGNFELSIFASDDNSSDKSKSILTEFGASIICGPNKGAAQNFLALIKAAPAADYYCFSDQDDIWFENKVARALRFLSDFDTPILYVGSSQTFAGRKLISKEQNLQQNLLRNSAQGCTMVFDKKLMQLLRKVPVQPVVMHDWWVHIFAQVHAKIVYDSTPSMFYRLHSANDTGLPTRAQMVKKYVRSLLIKGSNSQISKQVGLLNSISQDKINESFEMSHLYEGLTENLLARIHFVLTVHKLDESPLISFLLKLKIVRGSFLIK